GGVPTATGGTRRRTLPPPGAGFGHRLRRGGGGEGRRGLHRSCCQGERGPGGVSGGWGVPSCAATSAAQGHHQARIWSLGPGRPPPQVQLWLWGRCRQPPLLVVETHPHDPCIGREGKAAFWFRLLLTAEAPEPELSPSLLPPPSPTLDRPESGGGAGNGG
ncbi:unnamed protein product, partial [Discosporangium mesarthrocarpum]